ncbi:MAG: hypothetical protein ACBZ72_12745 [Candidatus Bathyarchaeia archaeon]
MTQDEGLRSSKAIAFIQRKYSQNPTRLRPKSYFTVRISLTLKATELLNATKNRVANRLKVKLMKNLGDQNWIK